MALRFLIVFWLFSVNVFCQSKKQPDYTSDNLVCKTEDNEILALYEKGMMALENPEYSNIAGKIFFNIIKKNEKLCDAYFYTGKALTKQGKDRAAYTYLYYADSIAAQPVFEFKIGLAEAALRIDNVGLARKKYEEAKQYFPNNPEGYYGISLTATSIGDVVEGLVNTDLVLMRYKDYGELTKVREQEIYLIRAILLLMNTQYEESLECFEKSKEHYGSTTDYLINYALVCYEMYLKTKEQKWKEKSQNALLEIQDKTIIKEDFLERFVYE